MIFDRKLFKERGKAAFLANYWRCVLVGFFLVLTGAYSSSSNSNSNSRNNRQNTYNSIRGAIGSGWEAIFAVLGVFIIVILLIAIAYAVFVANPLKVGCYRFFIKNANDSNTSVSEAGYGFAGGNYLGVVGGMFYRDLVIFLWCLCLIVPGIIASYKYRLAPYILAENCNMKMSDAMAESARMMEGHKWESFVLDFTFILWLILAGITFHIAGIFFVYPYFEATHAEMYLALSGGNRMNDSFGKGPVTFVDNAY